MAERFKSIGEAIRSVSTGTLGVDSRAFGRLLEAVRDNDLSFGGSRTMMWHVRVIRPDDMLILDFRGVGLRRAAGRLERSQAGQPAYLVVEHQSQALSDVAVIETGGQDQPNGTGPAKDPKLKGHENGALTEVKTDGVPATPVAIRAAGPSRVAYTMPAGIDHLDLNLDALLEACADWPLALDGNAVEEPGLTGVIVNFGGIGDELRSATVSARTALGGVLDDRILTALDAAAERIAVQSVAGIQAKRPVATRTLEAAAEREIAGLALDNRDDAAGSETRTIAALYLRAVAGERAVAQLQSAGLGIEALVELPGYFGALLKPHAPGKNRTAIEMPWRLIASPLPGAGFAHATQPVTRGTRTELWHTRLGQRMMAMPGVVNSGGVNDRALMKLRYLWSPDYGALTEGGPNFPLTPLDREMIVKLTAGFNEKLPNLTSSFTPRPVTAKRVILTALGGTLDAERRWNTRPAGVDLLAWTHRLSQGRDSYVRVEYAGFLFPFGHAATLVKLSERKFQWRGPKDRVAILRQRFFIVLREKRRTYPNGAPQPDLGRTMPFDAIEVMLDTTPDLAEPGKEPDQALASNFYGAARPRRMAFWPARDATHLFNFPFAGIDAAGRRVGFTAPVMFVSEVLNQKGIIETVAAHYNGLLARRTVATMNATMRFADADGAAAADVDLPAQSLVFRSASPVNGANQPTISTTQATTLQQQPIIESAKVRLATVERITGEAKTPKVVFDPAYVADGFGGNNLSELFLKLAVPETVAFGSSGAGSDAVGGIATPDMSPTALSRRHGVISGKPDGSGNVADGKFRPADFFGDAKLLGIFKLADILHVADLGNETPAFTSVERLAGDGLPERIETRFRLFQTLEDSPIDALKLNQGGTSTIDINATTMLFKDGTPPDATVEGTLVNFKLNLVGVLIIHFDRLHFLKKTGRKPDVDVDLNPDTGVTFGGPLEFINTLKDYIPANGFSDPPDLQVTSQGITAGYSLGLPAIQCGILSLSNISLGASFTLPFTGGAPTARFNFAERHNTFNLTVSLFGGGGFFAVVVGTDGVKEIEAALEFGAQIAINLGVASGSVYIKGGFYFHYAEDPGLIEFEGYVELGGRLSVLGLISVSLTFHLSLTYESKQLPDKANGSPRSQSRLFGQASLVVEIEILFFSASVSVKVEKTFAGSESDPLFRHFITDQSVWDDYCGAFA